MGRQGGSLYGGSSDPADLAVNRNHFNLCGFSLIETFHARHNITTQQTTDYLILLT